MKLRSYQKEAINQFECHQNSGILDMATGTGKTITSLFAADRYFEQHKRQFLIVIVPFLHLIDQWTQDFTLFDIDYYLEIAYSKNYWSTKLDELIWDYNRGYRKRVVIIGSYKSMADLDFQEKIQQIRGDRFLIADECHYLGSNQSRYNYFDQFEAKLGLSATPKRWWDDEGTAAINKTFGNIIFSYSMEEAIEKNVLTNYTYHPIMTELTTEELEEYKTLSMKIGQLMGKSKRTLTEEERLKKLVLQRSIVIQNAENKKELFYDQLIKQKDKRHTLVYCGKGQIDEIVARLSQLNVRVHRFNWQVASREREAILEQFSKGEIEVLVAIKCLDEGVDVPSTRVAYFLASTSNPREFIQRRGRILRKAKNKRLSLVYDFIVFPSNEGSFETIKSIATKEMPRFAEFSRFALNEYEARDTVSTYLSAYHLDHLMNITPWEMYELLKKEGELE